MNTNITTSLINYIKSPIVILNADLSIQEMSLGWRQYYKVKNSLRGESFFDSFPNIPNSFESTFSKCLSSGKSISSDAEKFIDHEGHIQWFKWQVSTFQSEDGIHHNILFEIEDITKRKKEEELLLKAEKVAQIGGWEVDLVTNKMYWTEITKEIHEVPMDYEPNLEEGINFYKAGEDREKITELVSTAIAEGTSWDTELRIITAKGKELWVWAKGEVELLDGKPIRICGTFQDIDQQKKADLEYKNISDRLTIATSAFRVAIWEYDVLKDEVYWDKEMYPLFGLSENDYSNVMEAWESIIHPDDKAATRKEFENAISGCKDFNSEFRVVLPSEEIRYFRSFGALQKDANGNITNIIGTNWDVTELKRTRLELDSSEKSFQSAFNNSAIGMALVALDGSWIKVNKNLCKITGYSEKELMAMTFLDITHPDDIDNDAIKKRDLIAGKINSYENTKRYRHKDGRIVHIIISVTAVKNIKGELSHVISQILNISKIVEAEARLRTLVEITKDQNESLLNFAHIVSHNLRSHASNMTMLTQFLLKEDNPVELSNLSEMLKNAAASLNETVLHLNEVVQVKTGGKEKSSPVVLLDTITQVKHNINALLQDKKAKCSITVPKDIIVQAIPAYMESIFLNLFTNALKYAAPERAPHITIKVKETKKEFYEIQFSDNGMGIDLERHKDKIFGMYKTFHQHKDAKGIGLFITKNQIEAMNGKISIESEVDRGTTFKIILKKSVRSK